MNKILVIEDHEADAAAIKAYLEEAAFKHQFYHSDTLKGGIDILSEDEIDLVLLDLSINDSTGFNTLKKYLNESSDVPVVVMTGNKNEIVGMQSVKAGAQDFLIKGEFDSKRLVQTIRYSLQRFKTQAQLQRTAEELTKKQKIQTETEHMANFAHWEMDIVSNSMIWAEEMFRIFGVQPNSFQPTLSDYLDFVHVEDRGKVADFFDEVIKTGDLKRLDHRILVNKRLVKYLTIQGRVNYDEHSNKIILIGSVQDNSYRLTDEADPGSEPLPAAEITPQLSSNELVKLGFGIRTPFNSMVNLIYLLEKSNPSPQQRELIDSLKTSMDDLSIELNHMLNHSLLLSDGISLVEEEFSPAEMLQNIQRVSRFKAQQRTLPVDFEEPQQMPELARGDQQKIAQVLHNLLEQIFKRALDDRKIKIQPQWFKRKKEFPFAFRIQYKGNSIPSSEELEEEHADVLRNLQTLQDTSEDNVVSLAIMYRLIEILGAKLVMKTDSGTQMIELTFPLQVVATEDQVVVQKPSGPKKILLVEDHVINQIATKMVLTSWSDLVEVDVAADGLEAVDMFDRHEYDLILMDLQMPNMDGLAATVKIRSSSKVPIVALTATSSRQEEEKCLSIGMNDYLLKPFKPDDLYGKIAKFL